MFRKKAIIWPTLISITFIPSFVKFWISEKYRMSIIINIDLLLKMFTVIIFSIKSVTIKVPALAMSSRQLLVQVSSFVHSQWNRNLLKRKRLKLVTFFPSNCWKRGFFRKLLNYMLLRHFWMVVAPHTTFRTALLTPRTTFLAPPLAAPTTLDFDFLN